MNLSILVFWFVVLYPEYGGNKFLRNVCNQSTVRFYHGITTHKTTDGMFSAVRI